MQADRTFRQRQIHLLDQLEALFFAEGYRAFAMSELARRLKCSKRSLYELAGDRQQLFCLVIERWSKRVREMGMAAQAAELSPRCRLEAFLEPGITETNAMTEAFLIDLRDLPAARSLLEAHQRDRMDHLKTLLDEGINAGVFKQVHSRLFAGAYLAAIAQINEPAFLQRAGLSFSQAFKELYNVLMTGLER